MVAVNAVYLLLPEHKCRYTVRMTYLLAALANLDELGADFYELQVGPLVQEVLLETQEEGGQASVWYSLDVVGVDHEDGAGALAQVAYLVGFF